MLKDHSLSYRQINILSYFDIFIKLLNDESVNERKFAIFNALSIIHNKN